MHAIRLLVLDVDGTVLTRDHRILPAVKAAVDRARASGLTLALATARSPRGLRPIAQELGIVEHCICFNGAWSGALGADPARSPARDETPLPLPHARSVARAALAEGLSVGWYVSEAWHVAALTPAILRESGVTGEVPVATDLTALDQAPHKILCIAGDDIDIPALHRTAHAFREHCAVSFSHRHFLEVTALGVDKAKAVAALASRLGTSLAQVAAIGDSDNDRRMIEAVGMGIAMGNASAEVRARAAWVTGTNQEAGVAHAIERLIESGACAVLEPMPCR